MTQDNDINIKLELIKEKDQNLSIITYFNKNSPNFYEQDDFYVWKPNNKEKNFIIEAFKLLLDNELQDTNKKLFKFSDRISEDSKILDNDDIEFQSDNEKSLKKSQIEVRHQNGIVNNKIINESINKNKIEKLKLSKVDQDKKIEKILMEKEKIN
jgi:hypothetical protein